MRVNTSSHRQKLLLAPALHPFQYFNHISIMWRLPVYSLPCDEHSFFPTHYSIYSERNHRLEIVEGHPCMGTCVHLAHFLVNRLSSTSKAGGRATKIPFRYLNCFQLGFGIFSVFTSFFFWEGGMTVFKLQIQY